MSIPNESEYYCRNLGQQIYFSNQASQMKHQSRIIPPHQLVPKTYPNSLSKVGCSRFLNIQNETEQSSLAIRSILPQQLPLHSQDPRKINIISSPDGFSDNPIKMGSNMIRLRPQQNDLTSNIIGTNLQRQNAQQLNIEKQIQLKPIRANIVKKQVHKLQNNQMAPRQTVDMGRQQKKVQNVPPPRQQKLGGGLSIFQKTGSTDHDDNVYEIKEVNRSSMWSALVGMVKPQTQPTSVTFSRKTGPATVFTSIQTKSNAQQKPLRREIDYDNESRRAKVGKYNNQDQLSQQRQSRRVLQDRAIPLHPNECPSCHGFYCSHCKSTIPAKYRPFWDQNQDPQLVEYYKRLQQQASKKLCQKCDYN